METTIGTRIPAYFTTSLLHAYARTYDLLAFVSAQNVIMCDASTAYSDDR